MFNFWDFNVDPEFIAVFKGQYKSVGAFKKNVYHFRTADKKSIHIWGLVQINNLFYGVPFGTKVRLKYLGIKKMPDSGRDFKDFEMEIISPPKDGDDKDDDDAKKS